MLSQTGSPLMPGPVPSVSTKTRGYTQPPTFHTNHRHCLNAVPVYASCSPVHGNSPDLMRKNRTSATPDQNLYGRSLHQPFWNDSLNYESDVYIPSYQKKVQANPINQNRNVNDRKYQHTDQQYMTIIRQPQQHYRPASVQPVNLVHRQYNSPMSLYSNNNIQQVMKDHVSHIDHVR